MKCKGNAKEVFKLVTLRKKKNLRGFCGDVKSTKILN